MYLSFIIFLFAFIKLSNSLNIKKKVNVLKTLHFLNTKIYRKKSSFTYLAKRESTRHEIYRKRLERQLKDALQSIIYKQGMKLNHKYQIDEDIIEGISVYKVQLSSDCSVAKVFVEILGDSIDSRQGYIWIKKNSKNIRYRLAQLIKEKKRVPFLNFVLSNLSEQTQLFCEMENIKEYYADIFKDEIENEKIK